MFDYHLRLGSSTHVWLSGQSLVADVATGFWNLVQAQDWAGLAEFVRTGDDTIPGTANADDLLGGDGNDIFNPGLGDGVLKGGRGADTMRWSEGHDVLDASDFWVI